MYGQEIFNGYLASKRIYWCVDMKPFLQYMPKVSRNEALARGLRYYWTGVQCKRGHICYRYADSGACFQCQRQKSDARRYEKRYPEGRSKNESRRKAEGIRDSLELESQLKEVWEI